MMRLVPDSEKMPDRLRHAFAQGASLALQDGHRHIALWHEHTPEYQGQRVGTVGACELDDSDESRSLLETAAGLLHNEFECRYVVGPMDGNTWLEHRLVTKNSARGAFLMEPMTPAHYLSVFRDAGFSVLSRYSSSRVDLRSVGGSYERLMGRMARADVEFRDISVEQFVEDLRAIHRLSVVSFSNNFLYTPLPEEMFVGKYAAAQESVDRELVILAEQAGELVGFVFCMPDGLAAQRGDPPALIVKTLAVRQKQELAGLGTCLVALAQERAKAKGYKEAIHALQYESNSSLRISQRFGAEVIRRYALMLREFS